MSAETSSTTFCCDTGSFPQVMGTVRYRNHNFEPVLVTFHDTDVLRAEPSSLIVPAGSESSLVTIIALSCPSDGASMEVVQSDVLRTRETSTTQLRVFGRERCDELHFIVSLLDRASDSEGDGLSFQAQLWWHSVGIAVLHSAASVPAKVPDVDSTEILGFGVMKFTFPFAALSDAFGAAAVEPQGPGTAAYPCGAGPNGFTVCPDIPALMPVEDYVFAWLATDGAIPVADPTMLYQYGFVFDANGVAADNYVPSPSFPNDFFAGSDRWYALQYSPANGWSLVVTDAGDFGIPPPHDWSGDVAPTVAQGLATWEDD